MDKRWNELFSLRGKSNLKEIKQQLGAISFSKSFKIINVVGTNGKGSATKMIANALEEQGYKVGLFVSPHIVLPNERISINGINISDKDFFSTFAKIDSNQFFASLFIVAMKYFQQQEVDYAVVEAGVGGKLDSTNAVDGDYGLLTSIALDHTEYLGNTHQKIFDDKIQIANPGMKFFVPTYLPKDVSIPYGINTIENDGNDYQSRNELLTSKFIKECFGIDLINKELPKGRTEVKEYKGQKCIFEVSHNLDGIKEATHYMEEHGIEYDEVVITLAKRKDPNGILELFKGKRIRYYKPNESFRDFDLEEIKDIKAYKPCAKTLFIGSFRLIGALYE